MIMIIKPNLHGTICRVRFVLYSDNSYVLKPLARVLRVFSNFLRLVVGVFRTYDLSYNTNRTRQVVPCKSGLMVIMMVMMMVMMMMTMNGGDDGDSGFKMDSCD